MIRTTCPRCLGKGLDPTGRDGRPCAFCIGLGWIYQDEQTLTGDESEMNVQPSKVDRQRIDDACRRMDRARLMGRIFVWSVRALIVLTIIAVIAVVLRVQGWL